MADEKGLEEKIAWAVRREVLKKDRKGNPKKFGHISFTVYPGDSDSISNLLTTILNEAHYEGGVARRETVEAKHPYNVFYTMDSKGREIPFARGTSGDYSTVSIDTKMMGLKLDDLTPEAVEAVLTKKGFVVSKDMPVHIRRVYDQGFIPQKLGKQLYYVRAQHVIDEAGNVIKDNGIRGKLGLEPYKEPEPQKSKGPKFG